MNYWGELPEEIDEKSSQLLSAVIDKKTPIQYDSVCFNANQHFQKNLADNTKTNENDSNKTGAFFETLKLLVAEELNNKDKNDNNQYQNLSSNEFNQSLRESVVMTLAYTGFHKAQNFTIELLIDILDYYLRSFAKLLRVFTDSIDLQSSNDFSDIIDKTLYHLNVPNIEALKVFSDSMNKYYQYVKNQTETSKKI